MKFELSFWRSTNMPVGIEGIAGVTSDQYVAGLQHKTYWWAKLGPVGVELMVSRPCDAFNVEGDCYVDGGEAAYDGIAPPA
jgi:hypothetical protein